jgi:hypothetical protein
MRREAFGSKSSFLPGSGIAEIDKSFSNFSDNVLIGSSGAAFGFSASGMAPLGDTMLPVTDQLSVLRTQELTPSYQEAVNYNVVSNTGGSYSGVLSNSHYSGRDLGHFLPHLYSEHQRHRQRPKCHRF